MTAQANRLAGETSPYLLQHAHNPVDWFPWGEEALQKARDEDRPILLSVGYSACHWCHVMERESFESPQIAAMMNQWFVNIKVDREERPDIDEVYMGAVQTMTGSGGWPMTVFLTPDGRPFYGGTYFPPEDRQGLPAFGRVLEAVAQHYRDQRSQVEERADQLVGLLSQGADWRADGQQPEAAVLDAAYAQLRRDYDAEHGGFGGPPKFPSSMGLQLLLRCHRRSGEKAALEMVEHSLKQMARGGLYDQLGGGFHRYSVDARWLVPHFEKMLYDNALLVWCYLEALQATGDAFYRQVVEETLGYVLKEMTQPQGGFYATQDADSEGEEGKFFVWDPDEVEALLGAEAARLFNGYYGVSREGNFENGKSVLHIDRDLEEAAGLLDVDTGTLQAALDEGRQALLRQRHQRVAPGRDEKILVSWNGLMISAMARAYQVLEVDAYLDAARAAAAFVLQNMVVDGRLRHSHKDGKAPQDAFQDDYAALVQALLDLYEADFDRRWLEAARHWAGVMLEEFWDADEGGFFYTPASGEALVVRTKNPFDNATPSGNSLAVLALLRLGVLTGEEDWRQRAAQTLAAFGPLMRRAPAALPLMIGAVDFYLEGPAEIALLGEAVNRRPFLRAVHRNYLPNKVLAAAAQAEDGLPLLARRQAPPGGTRAFVCRDYTCAQPVEDTAGLTALLPIRPSHGK